MNVVGRMCVMDVKNGKTLSAPQVRVLENLWAARSVSSGNPRWYHSTRALEERGLIQYVVPTAQLPGVPGYQLTAEGILMVRRLICNGQITTQYIARRESACRLEQAFWLDEAESWNCILGIA